MLQVFNMLICCMTKNDHITYVTICKRQEARTRSKLLLELDNRLWHKDLQNQEEENTKGTNDNEGTDACSWNKRDSPSLVQGIIILQSLTCSRDHHVTVSHSFKGSTTVTCIPTSYPYQLPHWLHSSLQWVWSV
jgi:hypothetical protein